MSRRLIRPKADRRNIKIFIFLVPVMVREATIKRQIVLEVQNIVEKIAASVRLKVPVKTA